MQPKTIQVKVSFQDRHVHREFPFSAAIDDVRKWALETLPNTIPTAPYNIAFLDPATGQEVTIDANVTDIKDLAHDGVNVLEFNLIPPIIKVSVNNTVCEFADSLQTGQSIKQRAIECGAQITVDFILSIEKPDGNTKTIGNSEEIRIENGQRYIAIPDDDNSDGDVNNQVSSAIDEIRSNFPDAQVHICPDGNGGAHITVDPIELGSPYAQESTWVGFHVPHVYPYSDIYPHFVRHDLSRLDNAVLGDGFASDKSFVTRCNTPGRPAVQISRRSKDSTVATHCVAKLLSVIDWLKSR